MRCRLLSDRWGFFFDSEGNLLQLYAPQKSG